MTKSEKVTTICYGKKTEWHSREEAENFFLEGMLACDGSEKERYTNIYLQLKEGRSTCSDEKF